jgi:hypothetical protein
MLASTTSIEVPAAGTYAMDARRIEGRVLRPAHPRLRPWAAELDARSFDAMCYHNSGQSLWVGWTPPPCVSGVLASFSPTMVAKSYRLMTRMGHGSPATALIYQHSSRVADANPRAD